MRDPDLGPTPERYVRKLFNEIRSASVLAQEEALADLLDYFLVQYARRPRKASYKLTELRAIETYKAFLNTRLDQNVSLVDLEQEARRDRFQLVRAHADRRHAAARMACSSVCTGVWNSSARDNRSQTSLRSPVSLTRRAFRTHVQTYSGDHSGALPQG